MSIIWTDDLPKRSGWYWWWSGDDSDAVMPVSIHYSGTDCKYFVARGQLGLTHAASLESFAGWWSVHPIEIPEVPNNTISKTGR